jgi:site-specific recombinase XerD
VAATSQTDLYSQIGKEARQERNRKELCCLGAANNWEMVIKAFTDGRKNYLEKKTIQGYLVLLKTFTDWLKETGFEAEMTPAYLSEGVIEEYLDYCLNTKNNSKRTANSKLTALKILYQFMVEKNLVTHNPAASVRKIIMEIFNRLLLVR